MLKLEFVVPQPRSTRSFIVILLHFLQLEI